VIEKNWQELIRPINPEIEPGRDPERKAIVTAEPLERGFGMTLGNALRRVLLCVREDVTNIVLNLKGLAVRMHAEGPKKLLLRKTGSGPVTGADIEETADVEILNKDHVICTADEGADIRMELTITTGKGYVPAAASRPEDAPIGLISIDALYSPVKRVAYRVEVTQRFCVRLMSLSCLCGLRTASRTTISFILVTLSKSPKPKCSVHQTLAVSH